MSIFLDLSFHLNSQDRSTQSLEDAKIEEKIIKIATTLQSLDETNRLYNGNLHLTNHHGRIIDHDRGELFSKCKKYSKKIKLLLDSFSELNHSQKSAVDFLNNRFQTIKEKSPSYYDFQIEKVSSCFSGIKEGIYYCFCGWWDVPANPNYNNYNTWHACHNQKRLQIETFYDRPMNYSKILFK